MEENPQPGDTKLEYNVATDNWDAFGHDGQKWQSLGSTTYARKGISTDMWFQSLAHNWKEKINGQHRTAAQAAYGNTCNTPTTGIGAGTFTVTGAGTGAVVTISSGGSGGFGSGVGLGYVPITTSATLPYGLMQAGTGGYFSQNPYQHTPPQSTLLRQLQAIQNQYPQMFAPGVVGIPGTVIASGGQMATESTVVPVGETKFGEIVAWRAWRYGPQGLLQSMAMETLWIPGEPMEGDPTMGFGGVYAWKSREAAVQYANPPYRIIGEIYLYGTVDEYEDGYRAQYAMIKSLDVVDDLAGVQIPSKPDINDMMAKLRSRYLKDQKGPAPE